MNAVSLKLLLIIKEHKEKGISIDDLIGVYRYYDKYISDDSLLFNIQSLHIFGKIVIDAINVEEPVSMGRRRVYYNGN